MVNPATTEPIESRLIVVTLPNLDGNEGRSIVTLAAEANKWDTSPAVAVKVSSELSVQPWYPVPISQMVKPYDRTGISEILHT